MALELATCIVVTQISQTHEGLTSRDTAAQRARSLWAKQENILRVISTGRFVNIFVLGNSISAFDELKRPLKRACIMASQSSRLVLKVVVSDNPADRQILCPKRRGATKYLNSWKKSNNATSFAVGHLSSHQNLINSSLIRSTFASLPEVCFVRVWNDTGAFPL